MTRDLMFSDEVHRLVQEAYEPLEAPAGPGARHYDETQLAVLPPGAAEWALGVGNPLRHAELQPGETVLDLGCGAGIDVLLSAREVGPGGRAIGVDFLQPMVDRARRFAAQAEVENACFVRSEIESLTLDDASIDSVISNGSVNLSARKSRVFAEAHRALKAGGRLCITDLTLPEEELPPQILTHPSAWAG